MSPDPSDLRMTSACPLRLSSIVLSVPVLGLTGLQSTAARPISGARHTNVKVRMTPKRIDIRASPPAEHNCVCSNSLSTAPDTLRSYVPDQGVTGSYEILYRG